MRTGIMARKIGMTRVYNANREHNSVTVLKMPSSIVLGHRNANIDNLTIINYRNRGSIAAARNKGAEVAT